MTEREVEEAIDATGKSSEHRDAVTIAVCLFLVVVAVLGTGTRFDEQQRQIDALRQQCAGAAKGTP